MEIRNDVIVVGAGPAGCACALKLAESGLRVLLLDKATFPRDKICGDALSVDVVNQLYQLNPQLAFEFNSLVTKLPSFGVRMYAPNLVHIDIPFFYKGSKRSGYICSRFDFDDLLVNHVKRSPKIRMIQNVSVLQVSHGADGMNVFTSLGTFKGSIVVGADGSQSVVKKNLLPENIDRKHYSAGLRQYFEGVKNFHPENFIELYFFKAVNPGYLWVFPMTDGRANVGIGMLSSLISKRSVNLRKVLNNVLHEHPLLRDRFAEAVPLETPQGHGLPLGSKQRKLSGDRFLLVGDAASMIDPFSGEGIGNALRSGRIAAEHIMKGYACQDFSAKFNEHYDAEIYKRMWKELKVSYSLQKLCSYPALFNFVIKKANKSEYWNDFLIKALADVNQKNEMRKPGFYYKLLFK